MVEFVVPSPPASCSFNTTWMPAALTRTVFGAGLEAIDTGTPPPITRVPLVIVVAPVVTRAPQSPVISDIDWIVSAFSCKSLGVRAPTTSISTVFAVAIAETCSLPGSADCALTTNNPVLKICPVGPLPIRTEAKVFVTL